MANSAPAAPPGGKPPPEGKPPPGGKPPPSQPPAAPSGGERSVGRFTMQCHTQEEEDKVDLASMRNYTTTGVIGSIANLIKGALGGGILSGHSAYMYAGWVTGAALNISFGIFVGYCFYIVARGYFSLLVQSYIKLFINVQFICTFGQIMEHTVGICSQIMARRCKVPSMSYPDVAEAAVGFFPNPSIARFSSCYRHFLDFIVCLNLFGSCACYQLMIAKTIKQLVEDRLEQSMEGLNGLPHLRIYIAIMIVPVICICLITQLKYLSPFSIVGNLIVALCCIMAIYYGVNENPSFSDLKAFTSFYGVFQYTGMAVFSMSTAGIFMPTENNMTEPHKFSFVMFVGYIFIVSMVFLTSFFGYVGYRENCKSPITINFPMDIFPKILKALIGIMVYVTHAVNFFMPFGVVFYYVKQKLNQDKIFMWELISRAIGVTCISIIAIIFPNVDALIGFLGSFCVCNMAFICPNTIYLLVHWHRPGLGPMKWRLWRSVVFIFIGGFIFVCGTGISFMELLETFKGK